MLSKKQILYMYILYNYAKKYLLLPTFYNQKKKKICNYVKNKILRT